MINRIENSIFVTLCLLFSASCSNDAVKWEESAFLSDADSCLIAIKPTNDAIDIGQYLDSVYYVKLEFTDESIIGQIDKVLIFENKIYVLDRQTASIFIFDMSGNYLSKICRIGQGPGDYITLNYFDIDTDKRHIIVTDLKSYWTIRYDLNGKYLSRKKMPVNMLGIAPLPDNKYVFFSNFRNNTRFIEPEYNIVYLDSLMQIEKVYFPYNSENFYKPTLQFASLPAGPFKTFENELQFVYLLKNEVYSVTPEGLALKYKFDFNGKNFNYDALFRKRGLQEYLNKGRYWTLFEINESKNILSFSFLENAERRLYNGFYSKSTGNVIHSTRFMLEKIRFLSSTLSSHEDWIITQLPVDYLTGWAKNVDKAKAEAEKGNMNALDFLPVHQALKDRKRMADSLTFDDNPVLMFFRLKPF